MYSKNWSQLKQAIETYIKQNGNKEITGDLLQIVLLGMVNTLGQYAQFAGVVTPESESPGAPECPMFFIASTDGAYPNYGGFVVDKTAKIFVWSSNAWHEFNTGLVIEKYLASEIETVKSDIAATDSSVDELLEAMMYLDAALTENTSAIENINKINVAQQKLHISHSHLNLHQVAGQSVPSIIDDNRADEYIKSYIPQEFLVNGLIVEYNTPDGWKAKRLIDSTFATEPFEDVNAQTTDNTKQINKNTSAIENINKTVSSVSKMRSVEYEYDFGAKKDSAYDVYIYNASSYGHMPIIQKNDSGGINIWIVSTDTLETAKHLSFNGYTPVGSDSNFNNRFVETDSYMFIKLYNSIIRIDKTTDEVKSIYDERLGIGELFIKNDYLITLNNAAVYLYTLDLEYYATYTPSSQGLSAHRLEYINDEPMLRTSLKGGSLYSINTSAAEDNPAFVQFSAIESSIYPVHKRKGDNFIFGITYGQDSKLCILTKDMNTSIYGESDILYGLSSSSKFLGDYFIYTRGSSTTGSQLLRYDAMRSYYANGIQYKIEKLFTKHKIAFATDGVNAYWIDPETNNLIKRKPF